MTYQVIARPEAAREIQEAFDWYEERTEGLGLEFLRAADVCLSAVRRNPEAYSIIQGRVRRTLLRREQPSDKHVRQIISLAVSHPANFIPGKLLG